MAGTRRHFDIVNGKQIALLVVPVLSFALASAAVALRWYTRRVRRVNTLTEDALCLAALAMGFCVVTLVYILVFLCGLGLSIDQIKSGSNRDYDAVERCWLRMQFGLDICWATSVAIVQLAFIKFYARLYDAKILARIACYFSMGLVGIWYIWSLVKWIIICPSDNKCYLQSKKACIIIGSLHVFFNAVILLAPIPAMFAARFSSEGRCWTMMIFFLGCFCTVLATLRIDCAINLLGDVNDDPIGASWWRIFFSPIEIAFGIICCCVPSVTRHGLGQRERHGLPTEGTGLQRLKFRMTSGSSSTSNLHPAHWMPGPKAQINAFVTLESARSLDQVGRNEIQVRKDYQLDRGRS
ncbi:hypothetical protein BDU57DRAFT_507131 [Ampelomyces quisqualis]|uniref:Rhodopsin domain-containing protein n=1 Tax=Ampelomyces quisqualis TaxID=50730 RepID=A0A6A5Q6Q4_AMPQU|nr:hypothetical protein BDU57DRAFT_507131 [Ampelomyces quisqualis]